MSKGPGLDRLWEAAERRQRVLAEHPRLNELEKAVAQAVLKAAPGQKGSTSVEQAIQARADYLRQHGIPADYAEPRWSCKACQDEGYVGGIPCACRQQAVLDSRIESSGLPAKLQRQTFDKFQLKWYSANTKTPQGVSERVCAQDALNCCRAFVASTIEGTPRKGLMISGEVGLGKTFLLSAICNSLVEAGVPTLYIVFSDLIADIKRSFDAGERGYSESQIMAAAKNAKVLILDDLGAEQVTEFVTNRLFDIVNHRCNGEKPLVLSSNLSLQEIRTIYGARIASRLYEMCEHIRIFGDDIRVRAQKERQA